MSKRILRYDFPTISFLYVLMLLEEVMLMPGSVLAKTMLEINNNTPKFLVCLLKYLASKP